MDRFFLRSAVILGIVIFFGIYLSRRGDFVSDEKAPPSRSLATYKNISENKKIETEVTKVSQNKEVKKQEKLSDKEERLYVDEPQEESVALPEAVPTAVVGQVVSHVDETEKAASFEENDFSERGPASVEEVSEPVPTNAIGKSLPSEGLDSSPTITPAPHVPSGGSAGPATPNFAVYANKQSGIYKTAQDVDLFISDGLSGEILYCKSVIATSSDPCCDPLSSPLTATYTESASLTVGSSLGAGECLSFYAENPTYGKTAVSYLKIKLGDLTIPASVTGTQTMTFQTTERFVFKYPKDASSTFPSDDGNATISYHRFSTTPLGTCEDISHTSAIDVTADGSADSFSYLDYINNSFDILLYGDPITPLMLNYSAPNYIVRVYKKSFEDGNLVSCATNEIQPQDFDMATILPMQVVRAPASLQEEFIGGFSAYNYIQESTTATATSGRGRYEDLQSEFMNSLF